MNNTIGSTNSGKSKSDLLLLLKLVEEGVYVIDPHVELWRQILTLKCDDDCTDETPADSA